MMRAFIRRTFLALYACAVASCATAPPRTAAPSRLPLAFTDAQFWQIITELSEPGGTFQSENYLSNELGFQRAIPFLSAQPLAHRAYLGVGPEQNFTYIASLDPQIAIIFDIRRGNMLGQLLYKALFEISDDRVDFVSKLFSKPIPDGLDGDVTVDSIFNAFWDTRTDSVLYRITRAQVFDNLLAQHKFPLTDEDTAQIRTIFDVFYYGGPRVDYLYPARSAGVTPSYRDLMVATDSANRQQSFLATEERWRRVRALEQRNLVIPVVADFAGATGLRATGEWLRGQRLTVGAFYLSNVEQYLFREMGAWRRFYDNVATMPYDSASVFIRATTSAPVPPPDPGAVPPRVNPRAKEPPNSIAYTKSTAGFISVTSSIAATIEAYRAGKLGAFEDVVGMSKD